MSEFYHAAARPSIVASLIKTSLHHGLAHLDALPMASIDGLLLAASSREARMPSAPQMIFITLQNRSSSISMKRIILAKSDRRAKKIGLSMKIRLT
jgi:hypothetical protein